MTASAATEVTARTDHFRGAIVPWDGGRRDQEILDHLCAGGVPFFDMNDVHQREYQQASGSFNEYLSPYMVGGDGHYNPRGNHFFAYALKEGDARAPPESAAAHGQNAAAALNRTNPHARQAARGPIGHMPRIAPGRRQLPGRRLALGGQTVRT